MVRPSKTPLALCTHRAQIFWVTQIRLSRVQTHTSLSSHSPFGPVRKNPATQALSVDWGAHPIVRPSKIQLCIHAQSTHISGHTNLSQYGTDRHLPFFTPTVNLDRKSQPLKHCHWTRVTQIWPSTVQTYTLSSHPLALSILTENSRHSSSHWTWVTQIWHKFD